MAIAVASPTKELVKDLAACHKCPGWEKWGKRANHVEDTGLEESASEVPTTNATSPRSAATGTPRKDDCSSEVPTAEVTSSVGTPRFTPRVTPPGTPRAANSAIARPSQPRNNRRNSRVSFVENLGLAADSDDELDGFKNIIQESMLCEDCSAPIVSAIHLGESDNESEDESDDDGDIYDEYDFDHTKISQMVQAGDEREKLTHAIEEAMAASLERKLKAKNAAPIKEIISSDNPYASGGYCPGQWLNTDETAYDLAGHMTPTEDTADNGPETVAERMQQAIASAKLRNRRSSAARKGATLDVITQAKKQAAMKRRASLATHMGAGEASEDVEGTFSLAMRNANRRHRQSISKAAEVLEDTDYGDNTQVSQVSEKMNMIEVAMAEARRRHRRSIAQAVADLPERPVGALNASAEAFTPASIANQSEQCQQNAGFNASAAVFVPPSYSEECQQNAGSGAEWSQQQTWNGEFQQGWDAASSPFQARINQAISSAYESHCYVEQQTYGDYDGYCAQGSCQNYEHSQQGGDYPSNQYGQHGSMQGQCCDMSSSQGGDGWSCQQSFGHEGSNQSNQYNQTGTVCQGQAGWSHTADGQQTFSHSGSNYQSNNQYGLSAVQQSFSHEGSYCQGDNFNQMNSMQGQCFGASNGQTQQTFNYEGASCQSNQYNQAGPMQGQCCATSGHQGQHGWSQAGNGEYYPQAGSLSKVNNVDTYSQFNGQASNCNEYCGDGYNQVPSQQYAANSWSGCSSGMPTCGGYANY